MSCCVAIRAKKFQFCHHARSPPPKLSLSPLPLAQSLNLSFTLVSVASSGPAFRTNNFTITLSCNPSTDLYSYISSGTLCIFRNNIFIMTIFLIFCVLCRCIELLAKKKNIDTKVRTVYHCRSQFPERKSKRE